MTHPCSLRGAVIKNDASRAIPATADLFILPFLPITDLVNLTIFLKQFCSRFVVAVCVVWVPLRKQRPQHPSPPPRKLTKKL